MRIVPLIFCFLGGILFLYGVGVRHDSAVTTSQLVTQPADQTAAESEKILLLYNWAEYIPMSLIAKFKKETGIDIIYSVFDSVETLEAQLLLDTAYDVVFPSAWPVFIRGVETKRFMRLNSEQLPNIANLDPQFMAKLGPYNPNDLYGVPYLWGTTGLGYDRTALLARAPDAPLDSWALVFDPKWSYLLRNGHVFLLDSVTDVLQAVLLYLGQSPSSQDPAVWDQAVMHIMKIRNNIEAFEGSKQIENLASGNNELMQIFSTYAQIAMEGNTRSGADIRYVIPKEGSVIWVDMIAIPHNAPHPKNAHLFINFMLRPENIAICTNAMKAANAIPKSYGMIDAKLISNPNIFPDEATMARIYPDFLPSPELSRYLCRQWCKIKMNYWPSNTLWSIWSFWPFSALCKK